MTLSIYLVSVSYLTYFTMPFAKHISPDMYLGVNVVENYSLPISLDLSRGISEQVQFYFSYGDNLDFRRSVARVTRLGANTIAINPMVWMNDLSSTEIQIDTSSRASLVAAIKYAKDRGLKVFLRPQIHLSNENTWIWRGAIAPEESGRPAWERWFASYRAMTAFYHEIALEAQADCYVFGVELMSSLAHIKQWRLILEEVVARAVKRKALMLLAYDALAYEEVFLILSRVASGDHDWLYFFSIIDHLGLNLYLNFTSKEVTEPILNDLNSNMTKFSNKLEASLIAANNTYLREIFPAKESKKIVIAEYGIKSSRGGLVDPFMHPSSKDIVDFAPQTLGFTAAFNHFSKIPWISGFLVWNMHVDSYYGEPEFPNRSTIDNGIRNFSISGKPAEAKLKELFDLTATGGQSELIYKTSSCIYFLSAVIIAILAIKKILLLINSRRVIVPNVSDSVRELPFVTIQLPMYNEQFVVERLLKAVFQVDYPRDKLEVQILDDSNDSTSLIVQKVICEAPAGFDIKHIQRDQRLGYKAGALAAGLKVSRGDFIAIFDADFIPPANFLMASIAEFANPRVGLVQGRWGFLNSNTSMLERVQSLFLNAHFLIEHQGRYLSNKFFNFNGTAGIFRKICIESAGGWHSVSLTEDLDLSYRAQLAGWKFVFRKDIVCPSELPKAFFALKRQQFRWSKGSAQVLRILLPRILSSKVSFGNKIEAIYHLISNCGAVIILSSVISFLVLSLNSAGLNSIVSIVVVALLCFSTLLNIIFYCVSGRLLARALYKSLQEIVIGMAVIVGLSVSNSVAVLEGLFNIKSPFERTPKWGEAKTNFLLASFRRFEAKKKVLIDIIIFITEVAILVLCLKSAHQQLLLSNYFELVFVITFAAGFIYVIFAGLADFILHKFARENFLRE
jgi:cellulose synthase/poly-beta-1,6-N-acetylglucosamine synthase-like glycosyltransferase